METPGDPNSNQRKGFVENFNKQLRKLKTKRFDGDDILNAMVKLYRNKSDAVEKLKRARLNPDLS
jgi:hypothetical protein